MTRDKIYEFFQRLRDANPDPKTELNYTSPFTLLVAVVLSAQATDKGVNKATPALFKAADTPQKMVKLGEDKIRDYIKTIGFYNSKAKNVYNLSRILVEEYGGKIPDNHDELVKLPGVGNKTANVVMNVIYGEPTIAVDTHVFRVSNRTGLATGATPDDVEAKLNKVVPDDFKQHAHHWLILHGRYTCIARHPKCAACVVYDLCAYKDKTA